MDLIFISNNMEILRDVTEVIHPSNFSSYNTDMYWGITPKGRVSINCDNVDGYMVQMIFQGDGMVSIGMFNGNKIIGCEFFDTHNTMGAGNAREAFNKLLVDKFNVHLLTK